ncbi:YdcF family protein [Pontibacter cellulosilyticus]|uniref:YdcF family protein n=1 Tax=Pontibacter cellulosilyticus TaxID=1720253 RepID=A0A923N8L0_9BACT|nr:YdcF family protein [Pontibacter cellulosilyticus]MBC5992450.1 YdcF family protein [Pontibacter cellulosilyticus]
MLEELIIRTLCDTLPSTPADAVFLFGQTEDNQQSVFASSVYLLSNKLAKKVMFLQAEPMSGYPGFDAWHKELEKLGVTQKEIEPVPVAADTTSLNTRKEAQAAIKHAREIGYKSIIASASPFQQPRAFMTAVTAVNDFYPELKVYSYPGRNLSWCEKVTHSQGKVHGTRAELIAGEMERIHKYGSMGDLAKVEEVLAYMNKRDRSISI